MVKINKLVKLGVESRAVELRGQDKSHSVIAKILSKETKETITTSSVQRFFASREQAKTQAVEKSDKLKAKVAEAEINTIDEAMTCIEEFKDICKLAKEEGDLKTAIQALEKVYTGLDIINKVLGKYQTAPQMQFNLTEVNVGATREKITGRINSIAARIGPSDDSQ
jgi:gas vesicle protein